MKKIILSLTIFCFCCLPVMAKNKMSADERLSTIEGKWHCDNDNVYVQRVISLENVDKVSIYNSLQEFLSSAYKDANEVLQVEDKESGLLVGKGNSSFYVEDMTWGSGIRQTVWHIFKAEIKDGRVRITISIDTVDWSTQGSNAGGVSISAKDGEYKISSCYPIGDDNSRKKRSGYVFYYAVNDIINLLDMSEEFLIEKQSATSIDDNW